MKQPKYWMELEEFDSTHESNNGNEFAQDLPIEETLSKTTKKGLSFSTNRRDFMKLFGFGITAATLSACNKTPLKKVVPYVEKPHDLIPGVANYYATTCMGCSSGCTVVAKTREGRPIKLEGNPDSPLFKGGLCGVGHSTVLNLYDINRLQGPLQGSEGANWDGIDKAIIDKLAAIKATGAGAKVRILTNSIISPSTLSVIAEFVAQFEDAKHITYDPVSATAIAESHDLNFGRRALPSYRFDKAEVIVSFGADFLGTWLNPVAFANQYAENRDPSKKKMSRHFQVESTLSLTGAKADVRVPVKPSELGLALLNLYRKIESKARPGEPTLIAGTVPEFNVAGNTLDRMADELIAARGKSLVVCGSNDVNNQQLVNAINALLGNYGTTVDLDHPSFIRQGNDRALAELVGELENRQVDALFVLNANPVYDTPYGSKLEKSIPQVDLSVALTTKADETSALCKYTAATPHYLEAWDDANPQYGQYSIVQPTINPIFDTRQAQDSFLKWGGSTTAYYEYLQNFWQTNLFGQQTAYASFQEFWDETLRKGVFTTPSANSPATAADFLGDGLTTAANALIAKSKNAPSGDSFDVVLYEKVAIRSGKHANNPWLQELPDPISRTTWGNYIMVPYAYGKEKGLRDGDVCKLEIGGKTLELPVLVQVGLAMNTVAVALGYGRTNAGKTADKVDGSSAYPLVKAEGGTLQYELSGGKLSSTGNFSRLAKFQKYDLLVDEEKEKQFGMPFDRSEYIIRETTLEEYVKNPAAGNEVREQIKHHLVSLWDSHFKDEESGRVIRWAMSIDLNKCTGCGSCVVSCHAENNVPVVGKQEIINHRDMHWLRMDRYYSGSKENPDVVIQPMLCQHCDNAPCETVCPVLATIHSSEGLNQMTYNRCVGTRYCANNCPYKVRRFNWFNYVNNPKHDFHMNNPLGQMVLNPDVTVRFRGVMEKCSFCVQRLQEGKLKAKIKGGTTLAKPEDGSIKTACQQSCPTGAILFGDLNDPESAISKAYKDARSFHALEELKTLPSVAYMTLVRNRKADEGQVEAKEEESVANVH